MRSDDDWVASIAFKKAGSGWMVVTSNLGCIARDESFFFQKVEAWAYYCEQKALMSPRNAMRPIVSAEPSPSVDATPEDDAHLFPFM